MIFEPLSLSGAYLITMEPRSDERGWFARSYCVREFSARGIDMQVVQSNVSFNGRRGIVRGLHYQSAPFEEAKLVRCTRGAIYDVVVDLRHASATSGRWEGRVLSEDNNKIMYVPCGFAHGYQTLSGESEIFYEMSAFYEPSAAKGVRWDDPVLAISWPDAANAIVSDRDKILPTLPELK